eukprot:jgi/Orpsp1_1/1192547/evm.model.d7180000094124.1
MKYNDLSKTAFFLSIYGYVLSKYSGQDIIYSSIVATNHNSYYYTNNMIGMFASTQPFLLNYDDEEISFLDIIKKNMDLLLNVYNNKNLSFSEISKRIKMKNLNNIFIFQPKFLFNQSSENMNNSIYIDEDEEKKSKNKTKSGKSNININVVNKKLESLNLKGNGLLRGFHERDNVYRDTRFDIMCNVYERENTYSVNM